MDPTLMPFAVGLFCLLSFALGFGVATFSAFHMLIEPAEKRYQADRAEWAKEREAWATERSRLLEKAVPGLQVRGEILPPRKSRTFTDAQEAALERKQAVRFRELEPESKP